MRKKRLITIVAFALGFTVAVMFESATDIFGRICRVLVFGLFASGFLMSAFAIQLGYLKEIKENEQAKVG